LSRGEIFEVKNPKIPSLPAKEAGVQGVIPMPGGTEQAPRGC